MIGLSLRSTADSTSTMALALGQSPGAVLYARFNNKWGEGGVYYTESAAKTITNVIANPPEGEPRSAGMLVGEAVTNHAANPSLAGAILGTVGSGGALPTHWAQTATGAGIDIDVIEIGQEAGLPYADLRFYGTPSNNWRIRFGPSAHVPMVPSDTITASLHTKLIAGTVAQTNHALLSTIYFDTGFISADFEHIDTTDPNLAPTSLTTNPDTGTSGGHAEFFSASKDATIDFTLRFAAPQLHFADSIKPIVLGSGITQTYAAAQPALVQGGESVPFPGYSGADQTFRIAWDADGVTGDRCLLSFRESVTARIDLHFAAGELRLEAFTNDISKGAAIVSGKDDGSAHTAVFYVNQSTRHLTIRVDGGIAVTETALEVPVPLELQVGHKGGENQFNGLVSELAAANGDHFALWS